MGTKGSRSLYDKLHDMDVRYVYLVVLLVVSAPILYPLGLPVGTIGKETLGLYNYIDELPPRSVILLIADQSPAAAAECQPGMIANMHHIIAKGHRILFYASRTDAPPFIEDAMKQVLGRSSDHPDYGKLYVNLGFIPQTEVGLAGLAADVFFTTTDAYGNDLRSMEFFQDLPNKNAGDWKLAIYYGASAVDWVVRQVTDVYPNCKTGGGVAAVLSSRVYPYYPHSVIGFLTGLRGSAEYEILVRRPGEAAAGMDAQSLGHLAIIIMILLGNIGYYASRGKPRGGA